MLFYTYLKRVDIGVCYQTMFPNGKQSVTTFSKGVIEALKYSFSWQTNIFAEGGYRGELIRSVKQFCGWDMEITLRSDEAVGFEVRPMRWL